MEHEKTLQKIINYSDTVWDILICPYCNNDLQATESGASCLTCNTNYEYSSFGSLDLRLQQPKSYPINFTLDTPIFAQGEPEFVPLKAKSAPAVDFSEFDVPFHLSRNLMSHFPRPKQDSNLMLDLGCGNTVHRSVCEHAGFEYVGLDYHTPEAPILGDGHALPFEDESFEFVFSIAVLEHIRFPFVMAQEVHRVLKPGGLFIGTVSFLEPFHGDSYYHHTHLGTFNLLNEIGFDVEIVAPAADWSVLDATAEMGLLAKMPRPLAKFLIWPLKIISKIWWRLTHAAGRKLATENNRILHNTGSFTFIATK